jgi:hypothetical protein
MDFVLNKDQVTELAAYFESLLPGLLKPRGRKPNQLSLVPLREECRRHLRRQRLGRRPPKRQR